MLTASTFSFEHLLAARALSLPRLRTTTLQINLGKLCNQACHHCHVEAGPKRTEAMNAQTVARIRELLALAPGIRTVDLTGGAPELNPLFRDLVHNIRSMGKQVIDRCNLTVLYESGQQDTAQFLADNQVQVVASLPCYSRANVEKQRGLGVFDRSIAALQRLNALGYGQSGTELQLHLVYNPGGAFLPPDQAKLESDYRRELADLFGIRFTSLYTITNMPIKRFLHELQRDGNYETYMQLLVDNFNPHAAQSVMCRDLISVSWDGQIYDCDFNQMLELPVVGRPTLWTIRDFADLAALPITFDNHCFGCSAGAGSSCTGATAP